MRTTILAAVGVATVLAGTAATTTTHASGLLGGLFGGSSSSSSSGLLGGVFGGSTSSPTIGLLGGLAGGSSSSSSSGLLGGSGLVSSGNIAGNVLNCLNILHAGGINLIGSGDSLGVGCTNTKLGAGYGTNLITLPPLPATPIAGSCQTLLSGIGTQLPLLGFPFSTGAGLKTSCGTDTSPLDSLTQLLGLG